MTDPLARKNAVVTAILRNDDLLFDLEKQLVRCIPQEMNAMEKTIMTLRKRNKLLQQEFEILQGA